MKKKNENIKPITCEEAEKSFNDLIDGYLSGKTKTELEHHIAHCKHCFGRIEFENKLKQKVRSSTPLGSPKTLRMRIEALLEAE